MIQSKNIPEIKLGLIAVSRDCFPVELSKKRRVAVGEACKKQRVPVAELATVIQSESDIAAAMQEIDKTKINALVIYLGNFGPEGPATILAQKFSGPSMVVAAAEESGNNLMGGRGDAYCGMLNASYNLGLRKLRPFIPEYPVGTPLEVAAMMGAFIPVARVIVGLRQLKIFTFGPRPQDFLACNAPIKPLYDLGVEIMENSELDLLDIYKSAEKDRAISSVVKEMVSELGKGGNTYPDMLVKLAQFECALTGFMHKNLGESKFGIFANKCWPAFEKYFGFTPCYVNSRLAAKGIPVACEVDIYGALSQYMVTCATAEPATLLDINNSVPADMYSAAKKGAAKGYAPTDLFMGFHCGNTPACRLVKPVLKYQLIMHRLMEPESKPNITRGTLDGRIKTSPATIFRLQSTADACLRSYVAQGEVLDIDPRSFGGIGVIAVREMGRFYRHVLIEKRFPHHTAMGFAHTGQALFAAVRMLGVEDIGFNQPAGMLYKTENPF